MRRTFACLLLLASAAPAQDRDRERVEKSVHRGLAWLAAHQDVQTNGRWDCDDFGKHDKQRGKGQGQALFDPGVSGLAILAFLRAGYTDRGAFRQNPYAKNVRMGLRYLMSIQDDEGCFGLRASHQFIYNHALATLAMSEVYGMTGNPRYRKPAQEGANFLAKARNPKMGWRYGVRPGDTDTSATVWAVLALRSVQFGGLHVDPDALKGPRAWLDKTTDPQTGRVGYRQAGGASARYKLTARKFPGDKTEAMTAAGVCLRLMVWREDPRTSEAVRKGLRLIVQTPPRWKEPHLDMIYWFFATAALGHVGGDDWEQWKRSVRNALLPEQAHDGSWDPAGPWGYAGGRIYSTALMTMCLEVTARLAPGAAVGAKAQEQRKR